LGIHEEDEEMKELAQDMQLENLKHNMVNNVLEAAKSELELKLDGECNFNLICNLLIFSICFVSYIMFVRLTTKPKHIEFGSTNSLGISYVKLKLTTHL
jgi:hypothetical protein